eukprot:CAMPEP_0179026606 /NCGR_PEP_ID=MMETSP0796-20121207/8601_1 /TAXON_ID=73915 /ORGANISM="Pyrodinium bahamense, Strain pbaha01" /LENGTH=1928 /DNA_ID=CAMNT_0020722691 /DNA_START=29 /DNA_END=5815 /DNA_ORIENTATION=-
MSEKVHPEEAVSDGEPLLKGEGTRVLITSHGDADSGPWVRIRTGHMAENYKYKQYEVCRNSLCFISYKWTFRQMVLSLIEWKWFDRFILLCIAVISLLNAAEDRRAPEDEGFNAVSKIIEHVINVIFLIELVLKVIGWGLLCHKNAYLRNPWNILDFLVVADAVLQWILPDLGGAFSVLRLFRALRPLRSLNAVPQMKGLVNTVLIAIPRLGNVILMAVFIFGIFAIAGITLMDGIFYRQCRETKEPVIAVQNNIRCWAWNFTDDDRYCGGAYKCTEGYCFGHEEDKNEALRPQFPGGRQGFDWCPGSEPSKNRLNPEIDFIHFDHIGGALLIVFQCMTMEGWTDIMYWVQDANGDILATVYFVLIICVTSHALLNIALAVIDEVRDDFGDEEEEEEEEELEDDPDISGQLSSHSEGVEEEPEPVVYWWNIAPVRCLYAIATHEIFLNFILLVIIANVIVMCLEKYPVEASWQEGIRITELVFLVIFCVEMVIMLGAVGPIAYCKNPVTAFDGIIVIITVVLEIVGQSGPFTALRTLRLFRVLNKLQDRWRSLRSLMKAIGFTALSLIYWLILFMLFLAIFSMIAQTFFATKFQFNDPDSFDAKLDSDEAWCPDRDQLPIGQKSWHYYQDCIPRAHFDTFLWAFTTIFQIMTGENWNTVMYAGMRATHWIYALFFMFLILFGQTLFLSLFLSILTSKFQMVSKQHMKEAEAKLREEKRRRSIHEKNSKTAIFFSNLKRTFSVRNAEEVPEQEGKDGATNRVDVKPRGSSPSQLVDGAKQEEEATQVLPLSANEEADEAGLDVPKPEGECAKMMSSEAAESPGEKADAATDTKRTCCSGWPYGYALCILHETNPIRRAARWILEASVTIRGEPIKVFDNFILLCILLSTVCMMLEVPTRDPEHLLSRVIRVADMVFAIIFIVEMVVKLVALGLVWGKDAYLRNGWNWLDGIVVVVSIITMVGGSGGELKILRILRALRPLRVISRNENLKVVVQTIFASVPDLATLLVVTFLFLLILAMICLSFLSGMFYYCPMDGDTMPAMLRDIPDLRTPLCIPENAPNKTFPIGYDNDEMAVPKGTWNLTTNKWDSGSCPSGRHSWERATIDTPICVGRCDPLERNKQSTPPEWLCPEKFKRTEELPPVGECANDPERTLTEDEQKGLNFVKSMQRALVMPCGGSTVLDDKVDHSAGSAASCRALFCPEESISDKVKDSCRKTCRRHPDFCASSCKDAHSVQDDSLTPQCQSCLNECEAQCECPDFCEPLIMDAALCHEQGQQWSPQLSQNFNNIWTSLLTLFEISTTEGWVDVMYSAADYDKGRYIQPKRDNQDVLWALFFVFYIFFMTMFLINLSVGIIVDRFLELKSTNTTNTTSDDGDAGKMGSVADHLVQEEALPADELAEPAEIQASDLRPGHAHMVREVHHGGDHAQHAPDEPEGIPLADGLVEPHAEVPELRVLRHLPGGGHPEDLRFALRLFQGQLERLRFHLRQRWGHQPGSQAHHGVDIVAVTGVVRIFRIARLFRIMRSFKEVNKIFMALILSLPKLANVGAILLLVLTLYGILGVQLFGTAKKPDDGTLDSHGNFDNFWKAFITLFRASTGEAWNELMHDLAKDERTFYREEDWCTPPDLFDTTNKYPVLKAKCLTEEPNACVQSIIPEVTNIIPIIYWVSYIVVCLHLMMNLVIAVILDGYEEGRQTPPEEKDIELCMERWKKYDPDITEQLPLPRAMAFINEVYGEIVKQQRQEQEEEEQEEDPENPFNKNKENVFVTRMPMQYAKCFDLVLLPDGQVSFSAATRQVLRLAAAGGKEENMAELEESSALMDTRTAKRLSFLEQKKKEGPGVDLALVVAATKLQRRFRAHKKQRPSQSSASSNAPPGADQDCGGSDDAGKDAGKAEHSLTDNPKVDECRAASAMSIVRVTPGEGTLTPAKAG